VPTPVLRDAFAHHVWATQRLIDACLPLSPEQLRTAVPGTYGSILETVRHLVEGDGFYLFAMTDDRTPVIDPAQMDLPELRAAMEAHGAAWSRLLARDFDGDTIFVEYDDDGFERRAAMGIGLALGFAPWDRSSEPDLHRAHDARRETALHRRLGLRDTQWPQCRISTWPAAQGDQPDLIGGASGVALSTEPEQATLGEWTPRSPIDPSPSSAGF
jgi:hypothetical protein